MRPALACTLVCCLIHAQARAQGSAPIELVASTPPRTPAEERAGFHLPEGFEIQLVAAEPDIHKPMNIAFDDLGRLWVTSTIEYPFPAREGTRPRDAVKVLDDFAPDGRARRVTTFADGLNIPIGILPLPSSRAALVYSIPEIERMEDTDGDGRMDRRAALYQTFGSRDTHGMTNAFTWGFDGWIYACHGYANDSVVAGSDHRPIRMNSGNTYRMRPDGSHAEYVTHGQVNPFGLALDPLGNFYTCDCHTLPLYQVLRGAWYPSFGKPHDGLGFGPEMMSHDHGSTGIAGIAYYAANQFPAAFRGSLFVGNVVTSRIHHDRLEWHGSTPRAEAQPDLVTSDDPWFRPVDFEIGPDGALYVADFYNRIIGHYEVPLMHPGRDRDRGRIWRIVFRGHPGDPAPAPAWVDWTRASIPALIDALADPNLAVRIKAANQLVERGRPAWARGTYPSALLAAIVASDPISERRVHALWVLERWGALDDETLNTAARDRDRAVRVHAHRVLGERPALAGALRDLAARGLSDDDPFVRRAAAEALGRHPETANIRLLLDLRQATTPDDTHLVHVVRMALRDQLRPADSWAALARLGLSDRNARDVADVATGVPSAEAAIFLLHHIQRLSESPENLLRSVHHVARYGTGDSDRELVAFVRDRHGADLARLAGLLKAVQQGTQERGTALGAEATALASESAHSLLDSARGDDVQAGIDLAAAFQLQTAWDRLEALALGARVGEPHRVAAIAALVAIDPRRPVAVLGRILADPDASLAVREQAALALTRTNQTEAQAELLQALPAAPGRLQTAIAVGLASRPTGAGALLEAVASGKASARLLQYRPVEVRLGEAGLPNLQDRLAGLLRGLPPADQRLGDLLDRRREGFAAGRHDPAVGAQVFEKHCAICHQLGGKGARIGPQLDGVGVRGADRLLEDILDPNRNVDQAFRTTSLALDDGQLVSGLLLREEGAILVVADAQGKEVRVPKQKVEERTTTPLSPMPANLTDQVSEPDLYRLLAYLLSQKTGGEPRSPKPPDRP
jgi:putative heme-binding domain-containing protein